MSNELKIFTGTANTALANEICEYLKVELGQSSMTRFSDGEIYFQILENVRGVEVIRFAAQDVVRHRLVAHIVEAYHRDEGARGGT